MKTFLSIVTLFFITFSSNGQHKLVKIWETDTILKVPESVIYNAKNKVLYVSNIDGKKPWEKDGQGSIGKVGLDGKILKVDWIKGLNAPKGLGIFKNKLYVADITDVVVIDILKEQIIQKIAIENSQGLNDIAIDKNGVVYVSDSKTKKVHQIKDDISTVLLENLNFPNGLFIQNDALYLLDNGAMYRIESNKKLSLICNGMEGGTDGLESVGNNEFLVSCWEGAIWFVDSNGKKELLLDTRNQKINTADIGYDPETKTVFVPTFWKNKVVAYQLSLK